MDTGRREKPPGGNRNDARHAVDSTTGDGVQPSGDFATGAVSLVPSPTCVGHTKQTICGSEPSAHVRAERETDMKDETMETSNWLGMVQCIDTEDTEWVHGTTEDEKHILHKIFVNLKMEGQIVKFQVDTGATCNVIGSQDIPQGGRLSPTTKILRLYDATPIKILGTFQTRLVDSATGKYCNAEIIMVQSPSVVPLLGAPSSLELQVIEFNKRTGWQKSVSQQVQHPRQRKHILTNLRTSLMESS